MPGNLSVHHFVQLAESWRLPSRKVGLYLSLDRSMTQVMLANSLFYLEISDMSYSYEARLFESKKGLKCLIKRNVSPEKLFDHIYISMTP